MSGIDLNQPLQYKHASMRFFEVHESHVNRLCKDDVLLLVFDGILRFSEDGVQYEVRPGEYHIQKHGSRQYGYAPSDSPKYLYVHFYGQWAETGAVLPVRGRFNCEGFLPLMEQLDQLSHSGATVTEQLSIFTQILTRLYRRDKQDTPALQIGAYLAEHIRGSVSLDRLSAEFHFSKNHIINLFKQEYGTTPTEYLNTLRLQKAKHLLEATSAPAEDIAGACGFHNYSHFYRLFLRETGISPTQWRSRKRLEP